MQTLATIGYQGSVVADFIDTLIDAGIERLIDVREVPLSRKRGFSKRALSEALGGVGIHYAHLRALGDPKPGRDAARRGDHHAFTRIYNSHLAGPAPQAALDLAEAYASDAPSCLMCFERDYVDCHRNIVAIALAERRDFRVRHLIVPMAI
jgi:uncharacterized protein (DUF488 family)